MGGIGKPRGAPVPTRAFLPETVGEGDFNQLTLGVPFVAAPPVGGQVAVGVLLKVCFPTTKPQDECLSHCGLA
jgi:hypothetical protein